MSQRPKGQITAPRPPIWAFNLNRLLIVEPAQTFVLLDQAQNLAQHILRIRSLKRFRGQLINLNCVRFNFSHCRHRPRRMWNPRAALMEQPYFGLVRPPWRAEHAHRTA